MPKNYTNWHTQKTALDASEKQYYFQEREIWWCAIGLNVGFEQDGKGQEFERPILIVKKFNLNIFLAIPLTTTTKEGKYYFPIGFFGGRDSVAVLSQIRLYDAKRLSNKIGTLDKLKFEKIKKALKEANFS